MIAVLSFIDYIVLAFILIFPVFIGIFYGIKNKSIKLTNAKDLDNEKSLVSEFLTASSSMSYFPVALSLLASFISTTSLLGMPAEVYQYGIQYWISAFGMMLAPLIGLTNTNELKSLFSNYFLEIYLFFNNRRLLYGTFFPQT